MSSLVPNIREAQRNKGKKQERIDDPEDDMTPASCCRQFYVQLRSEKCTGKIGLLVGESGPDRRSKKAKDNFDLDQYHYHYCGVDVGETGKPIHSRWIVAGRHG